MNQFSKFLIVGVFNTALGYSVIFSCMYLVGLTPEFSNAAGYAVGLIVSYFLNRHFTFRSIQRRSTEFVRFAIVFLIAYMANLAVLIVLVRGLAVHAGLSQVIASVIYVGIAYILNKHYVFRALGTWASPEISFSGRKGKTPHEFGNVKSFMKKRWDV